MNSAREHNCKRCSDLRQWILEEPLPAPPVPERLQARLLPSHIEAVTPLPSASVLAGQIFGIFLLFAVIAILIRGVAGIEHMTLTQLTGMGAVLGAGLALQCASLAWQMIPGSRRLYIPTTAVVALAAAFPLSVLLLFRLTKPDAFLASGLVCLGAGILLALIASILLGLYVRRGATLEPRPLAASLGATAGLAGVTVLQISCPQQNLAHLFAWHGGVLLLAITLASVGAAVRARS